VRDVEEVEAELRSQLEEDAVRVSGGSAKTSANDDGEEREAEERHPVERHARRAQLERRRDQVDRRRDRRDAVEDQAEGVEVDVEAGVVRAKRKRHVVEPPGVRREAHEKTRIDEAARTEEEPVGECVQPRKRHVPRADHQRQQIVAERADRHRDNEEEDHRHPVRREELVEQFGETRCRSAARAACA
jgi:hypothetical protein